MNFLKDNAYYIIIASVVLFVGIFLVHYYVTSSIESSITPLQKQMRRLLHDLEQKTLETFNNDLLEDTKIDDGLNLESDVDSYFDPSKS